MPDISVILPTYNEKDNIVPLILDIHRELGSRNHELIIIDDNSTDGTFEIVSGLGHPYLRTFLRTADRGLAASIRYGIEKACGRSIIIMDTDFNHQPRYIPYLLKMLEECDCASASRFIKGGAMDSRARGFLSGCFNVFVRIITGGRLTDYLYGYLAVKRDKLDILDMDSIFYGFGDYCIRLLLLMEKKELTVREIPAVNGRRRSGSSTHFLPGTLLLYVKETLKMAKWRKFNNRV